MESEIIIMFFLGLIGNIVGTLVGGGALITLPAMILFNTPVQAGIGANKFATGIATLTNIIYLLRKKLITFRLIFEIVLIGGLGGIAGALITSNLTERTLNVAVIILLVIAVIVTIFKPFKQNVDGASLSLTKRSKFFYSIGTFLVGIYNGGFGPGSATFGILLYMKQGFEYIKSAHMTRILIFGGNISAFMIYLYSGLILWHYTIPLSIGAIIGGHIGILILPKIPEETARKLLVGITLLLIIQVSFKLF